MQGMSKANHPARIDRMMAKTMHTRLPAVEA
jgi:hypothetical protein